VSMFESCLAKQKAIIELFAKCLTVESRYQQIIDLGKTQISLDATIKTPENLVQGCQSKMYLHSSFTGGKVLFQTESDAIISAGLGILLTRVYSGEAPDVILKCPPAYIDELGILASLTPGRANGLGSIYLRMKQDALKYYMQSSNRTN
jgi:cysteine desulfuration protein SufE